MLMVFNFACELGLIISASWSLSAKPMHISKTAGKALTLYMIKSY